MLSTDTIAAAQTNDMDAMAEVIKHMEPKISQIAGRIGGNSDRDDLIQEGRIALWTGIGRFTGGTVDNFHAFMYRTIEGAIQEAAREERNAGATGADRDATKVFSACMKEANGDIDVAEKLTQTLPPKGRRLSATRANAARMAWEGSVSLDAPNSDGEDMSLADTLVSDYGVPDDLVTEQDRRADTRDRKIKVVRAVIDSMGAKGAHILKATYGIDPVPCLGTGAEADAELAEELATKPATVRVLRNQAHKSFEARYTKVTGMTA
ncbi:DNA-directed RNA polymerase subunit alpha [Streptomyces phage Sycamore]|uniref:DNA-directed RNA polymerase subunit alpha n=1 Tax=Streptomyces phage Sycamore TaxID=2767589 RepID=A0A873WVI1_9CAUD|nr:DNA-directed RNA polymerase subunit alpha [Streptomyces phage Sycamore]